MGSSSDSDSDSDGALEYKTVKQVKWSDDEDSGKRGGIIAFGWSRVEP
jgi:hypothetical protein